MRLPHPDDGSLERQSFDLALAVADVSWFTTENLFRELNEPGVSILALRCMDYLNGWRQGVYPWSSSSRLRSWGHHSLARDMVLPSGWMKLYPRLGMRPIARNIRRFWSGFEAGARRGLVITYPYYLYLRDQLQPDISLYYNIDDYTLYWPNRVNEIRRLERETVLASNVTVCVARSRAEELRTTVPNAVGKIHHIPHGTPSAFLAEQGLTRPAPAPPDIAHLPRPLIGYIGSIEDRIDWPLMEQLSASLPEASIVVVGRVPHAINEGWYRSCARFLSRSNVHAIGWRPHAALPAYYQSFDVILIPYCCDHPFNRACSPTKIMDGMGSGRPIVATAIPECRLYSRLFDVAENTEEFVAAVGAIIENGSDDGRCLLRHAHARENTCRLVASRVVDTLMNSGATECRIAGQVPR
jgi:glycosyltransferase involved in cell wall biosynthesis